MEVQTAWVKAPKHIGGLDHLAVQAPCINLYGRLLPGITNVTDRARYYTFYPWIVWALEEKGHKFNDLFIDQFRRADCLFTLIAQRHAFVSGSDRDDHAAAKIGSANLSQQISDVREDKPIRLSDYAHREEGKPKYFKNKLGGLGQYYLGVFRELNIMDGTIGSGIKNTNQIGKVLAESLDNYVDRDLFISTLEEDIVNPDRLDKLSCFCSCHLPHSSTEHSLLCDLFFVIGLFSDKDMLPRRRTLQLILYLIDSLAKRQISIDLIHFRGCTYCGALPDGEKWVLPDNLQSNRKKWAIYERNELLSIAIQGLFYALLDSYFESGHRFFYVEELCRWFIETPEVNQINDVFGLENRLEELYKSSNDWLPQFNNWGHPDHEVQLSNKIVRLCDQEKTVDNRAEIILSSLKILLALNNRHDTSEGYGDFVFTGNYFNYYPINLNSFNVLSINNWKPITLKEWIEWLSSNWGVKAHLQVALRKLRGQSQSTFRIRPSDLGLEVIDVPKAVFTSPRFNQTLRILKDIGMVIKEDKYWICSDLGHQMKDFYDE